MAIEERLGVEPSVDNPLADWLVQYSAHMRNRCEVGHDGKMAYERVGGKAHLVGVEFGEVVHWKKG